MNYFTDIDLIKIKNKIIDCKNILITGHLNPDGDCVGSALALFYFIRKYNSNVKILLPNDFPESLKWLKKSQQIIIFDKENSEHQKLFDGSDLIFAVDYNELKRCGNIGDFIDKSSAFKIMLDHHPQPVAFCDVIISNISVSSASELMFYFLKAINPEFLDKNIAEAILTGIIMDTGVFNFNSSNPDTYLTIAELLKLDADKEKIINNLYNTSTEDRLRLMGFVFSKKLIVIHEKNTAFISLTSQELKKFNHKIGDTEGFVNMPLSIDEIKFSAFFMESENCIKVSLRSKGSFDVNEFARTYYKGGGHKNASGGKSFKSMNKTLEEFEGIIKYLKI